MNQWRNRSPLRTDSSNGGCLKYKLGRRWEGSAKEKCAVACMVRRTSCGRELDHDAVLLHLASWKRRRRRWQWGRRRRPRTQGNEEANGHPGGGDQKEPEKSEDDKTPIPFGTRWPQIKSLTASIRGRKLYRLANCHVNLALCHWYHSASGS